VDALCAGFACQDLSCAGSQRGLVDGARTGPTYRHLLRFAEALHPQIVVMENVPALLSRWQRHLERDWRQLGYGLTWVRCRALDVGTPHIRRRVFVVAVRGDLGRGVIDAPRGGAWPPGADRGWPAPRASDAHGPGYWWAHEGGECLSVAVRPWPTATAGDAKASGSRCLDSAAHEGTSLTDAVRPDRAVARERLWATPQARDYKCGDTPNRVGSAALLEQAAHGKRLNPDWVETLVGFPPGWTLPEGERLDCDPSPRWPRGRYPADWERSVLWPGYDWEPLRTIPDGPPIPGRPARIRALGNAVVPQQGALAIRAALDSQTLDLRRRR